MYNRWTELDRTASSHLAARGQVNSLYSPAPNAAWSVRYTNGVLARRSRVHTGIPSGTPHNTLLSTTAASVGANNSFGRTNAPIGGNFNPNLGKYKSYSGEYTAMENGKRREEESANKREQSPRITRRTLARYYPSGAAGF